MTDTLIRFLLTDRDLQLLETLALKVRMFTLEQIASGWWGTTTRTLFNARRRLHQLIKAGFLLRYTLDARPLLASARPVFSWSPGEPPPEAEAISWKLQSRWAEGKPSRPTKIYMASQRAVNLFGGYGGHLKDPFSATHDLHMGQVYLYYFHHRPREAARWLGEDAFEKAGYGIKDPDAFICNEQGERIRVVDFGGSYDASRVAAFHVYCWERYLPYELW